MKDFIDVSEETLEELMNEGKGEVDDIWFDKIKVNIGTEPVLDDGGNRELEGRSDKADSEKLDADVSGLDKDPGCTLR